MTKEGQIFIAARGGRGGWGNVHFATATHQTPYESKKGTPGEEKVIKMEMQMIADVGIIGLPNAGKSTLLSHISNARPKIANYPFTTLAPNLGVVKVDNDFSFIAADIPGLIEGASQGKGLGDKFLKHVQRTNLLVHLIDINSLDPAKDYKIIRQELKKFDANLAKKKEIVAFNKIETIDEESIKYQVSSIKTVTRKKPFLISSAIGKGIKELLYRIKKEL
ncbi:Obg family GTPase CgtA [Candidatus Berkelbacteria bacterium RIFCSPHIGHO2_12_FULL_36_9]|uniref:Obg family GTPase CgtA n=1 Tax=Candidatus Berkelbacteria bacterium RIFCSPHIGHO2_12_FULL_36_9 TaxID=1797469 RepID=A0A1F5EHN6_9BACT|nr:MAG: Obg family GTPase CgtA [Candidatus Berkelbacteria bacterium RIFCSPHIGHO2_12_FULL_36_9]